MADKNETSNSARPLISVVVPCRNERDHIRCCVECILGQKAVPGGFEVIVADGMSTDGTLQVLNELAAAHRQLKVVENPCKITPSGMNAGIRASRAQWIAIMGAHNRYASDYLARCLAIARKTGADNVGGAMVCEGHTPIQKAIAAAHHSPFAVGGARWHNPDYEGPADTVFGGFYRRDVFDRIGLFDESLVRNQDDEFNLRLTRTGGRIWHSPEIRSWYNPRHSLAALFRQYYQYGYWKVRVIQKQKLPASWRHLVPGAFVLTLILLTFASLLLPLCPLFGLLVRGPWSDIPLLARFSLFLALTSYLLAVSFASILTAKRAGWKLLPVLPAVFACYHFGYGWGFLRGVWDFVIRKRHPQESFTALTR